MKTSQITQIVLAIALVVLYILHFTKGNSNNNTPKNAAPIKVSNKDNKNSEAKIAYYNVDSLMSKYTYYINAKKTSENEGRIIQSDLNARKGALENAVVSFQNSAATMTQQKIEETKQGLMMKEKELMQYGQSQENEMMKKEQKIAEKMVDNIAEFLKKYAEANGYSMIYAYSKTNFTVGLTYAQSSYEITDEIIKGLNEDYKNQTKK